MCCKLACLVPAILMQVTQWLAILVNSHETVANDSKHHFKGRHFPHASLFNSSSFKTLGMLFKGYPSVKENVTIVFYVSVFTKSKVPRVREVIHCQVIS